MFLSLRLQSVLYQSTPFIQRLLYSAGKAELLKNEAITAPNVLLMDAAGINLGLHPIADALAKVQKETQDLVLVNGKINPPIARIMARKEEEPKLKWRPTNDKEEIAATKNRKYEKEIVFGSSIQENDYKVRIKRIMNFLEKNHRVRILITRKGLMRFDMSAILAMYYKVIEELKDVSNLYVGPMCDGRSITFVLVPKVVSVESRNVKGMTDDQMKKKIVEQFEKEALERKEKNLKK
ncbi:hypothetical protein ROZALSC1DRAFT_28371 [Rozella allomycis CSF55]|uniref:Translation initiation factor 3 domain-containing protein n=1 Tax=Rozella allomycis (strain CSF55) TaxID=988480 RepID=A0A075AUB6_ROZAC|nr:Translation initiation factor 3 domain-containing protein [Rozella allomycis CSF55]RKP20101.1 hypothetical protein ROZALSC1DRAFT_28371 [Rozella allomycis CSF55]|eukprot:EPZ32077.1 Translation initiation factor 3 domain-containing protein [Rozella allomycis CSF55]